MYQVLMPRLGITMEEGRLARWLKAEGDAIQQGEMLFELESEKVVLEVEAQVSGILSKILVEEDEVVAINTPVALIAIEGGEALAEASMQALPETQIASEPLVEPAFQQVAAASDTVAAASPMMLSPYLRKLAGDLGVDLSAIHHEDPARPITEELLRARAADKSTASQGSGAQPDAADQNDNIVALSAMQRAMAANVARAWTQVPHFTQIVSIDMTKVLASKAKWDGAKLNDILLWLLAQEAVLHPWIIGRLEGDTVLLGKHADLSFAVATPNGLTVPVIHKAETLSLKALVSQTTELVVKARDGRLSLADLEGGSITFSNLGAAGIETGTPIINAPQSTLVFAGAIIRQLVVGEDDAIRIAPIMKLSVSFDHRFIDGSRAAAFTTGLKTRIETLTLP